MSEKHEVRIGTLFDNFAEGHPRRECLLPRIMRGGPPRAVSVERVAFLELQVCFA